MPPINGTVASGTIVDGVTETARLKIVSSRNVYAKPLVEISFRRSNTATTSGTTASSYGAGSWSSNLPVATKPWSNGRTQAFEALRYWFESTWFYHGPLAELADAGALNPLTLIPGSSPGGTTVAELEGGPEGARLITERTGLGP